MRRAVATSVIAAMSLVCVTAARAQGRVSSGTRMYDPKTVETVTGTVVKVEHAGHGGPHGVHGAAGVQLLLKTDTQQIAVRLGPAWYVDKQSVKVAAHDTISVRGSRIVYAGKPAIVAAQVKKGDQVMNLRRDNGVPLWHVHAPRRAAG
jgi:hypothetical protein